MSHSLRITVCVATKNRTDMLHQLLWSLIRQQYAAWDLLIVDDSDVPVPWDRIGVYPRLFSEMKRTGHEVRIAAGPRVNRIGAAFQVGFAASDPVNPLFFRVDDDAWLEPDYLKLLASVMGDADVGACGGLFLHPGKELEVLRRGDERYRHTSIEHLSDAVNIQWLRHECDTLIPVEHLTANILFNRKWLERIGGFEAYLYQQHRDETQASWRLHVEGAGLVVDPRAVAWHLRGVNGGARGHNPDVYLNDHRTFMAQRRTMKPGIHIHLGHALGDGLMATPMLASMRKMDPDRNIAVFAPWAADVLTGNPAVDEIADNPLDAQRTVRLDQSVYGWASAHGWKGHLVEAYCRMFNLPGPEDVTPQLYLDNETVDPSVPAAQEGQSDGGCSSSMQEQGLRSVLMDPYVVIAPWSTAKTFDFFGPSGNKDWMADRWAEIVARIHAEGRYVTTDLKADVVPAEAGNSERRDSCFRRSDEQIAGPAGDNPSCCSIRGIPTKVIQIRGNEDEPAIEGVDVIWTGQPIREVFRLIKDAALVISVDTFAHHAAAAFGVPAVVLWGRSKPEHFGYRKPFIVNIRGECPGVTVQRKIVGIADPPGPHPSEDGGQRATSHSETVRVIQDRPCINGDQWAMDQAVCPIESHPCMAGISVDDVWEAAAKVLQSTAEGAAASGGDEP